MLQAVNTLCVHTIIFNEVFFTALLDDLLVRVLINIVIHIIVNLHLWDGRNRCGGMHEPCTISRFVLFAFMSFEVSEHA